MYWSEAFDITLPNWNQIKKYFDLESTDKWKNNLKGLLI